MLADPRDEAALAASVPRIWKSSASGQANVVFVACEDQSQSSATRPIEAGVVPRPLEHRLESNMPWATLLLKAEKLCPIEAAVAALIMMVTLVLAAVRWRRRYHRQTLILLRSMAFYMIQNRPPTDDPMRLQENVNWWEREVVITLPKAGAKSGEIAQFTRFGAAGDVYHRGMIVGKIARLDTIIDRLERQG